MKIRDGDYGGLLWRDKKRPFFGMPWSFTHYILSNDRLYVNRGLLSVREDRLELYRVVDVALIVPWTQDLFNCGTIEIHSQDRTNPVIYLTSVKDPRKVLELLETCVARERRRYGIAGRDMFGALGN
jgi:hypothetical protein